MHSSLEALNYGSMRQKSEALQSIDRSLGLAVAVQEVVHASQVAPRVL